MNANEVYPSKYLKAQDLNDVPPVLTIADTRKEAMPDGTEKPVVTFREAEKGLVCNKTNWTSLIDLFGSETNEWKGRRISLIAVHVDFKGKPVLSVRVTPVRHSPLASVQPVPTEQDIPF